MSGHDPHIFEMVMLCCFGFSWPFAIIKTVRSQTVQGKSIVFIILVFIGYLCGIISKWMGSGDPVIWCYVVNGSLVFTEIVLYFKYNRDGVHRLVRRFGFKGETLGSMKKGYGLDEPAL